MATTLTATSSTFGHNPLADRIGLRGVTPASASVRAYLDDIPGISAELAGNLRPDGDTVLQAIVVLDKLHATAWTELLTELRLLLLQQTTTPLTLDQTRKPAPMVRGNALMATNDNHTTRCDVQLPDGTCLNVDGVVFILGASASSLTPTLRVRVLDRLPGAVAGELLGEESYTLSGLHPGANFIALPADKSQLIAGEPGMHLIEFALDNVPSNQLRWLSAAVENGSFLDVYWSGLNDLTALQDQVPILPLLRVEYNMAELVEAVSHTLTDAYKYLMAAGLLNEKLTSPLVNLFTNTPRDDTAARIDEYKCDAKKRIKLAVAEILSRRKELLGAADTPNPDVQGGVFTGSVLDGAPGYGMRQLGEY